MVLTQNFSSMLQASTHSLSRMSKSADSTFLRLFRLTAWRQSWMDRTLWLLLKQVRPILSPLFLHVLIASLGSGKTAAFLAPVISKLLSKKVRRADDRFNTRGEPLVLLIAPTRELALQIAQDCRRLCYRSKLRVMTLHGGTSKISQLKELRLGCDILIGTAGRLVDILTTATGDLSLKSLQYALFHLQSYRNVELTLNHTDT